MTTSMTNFEMADRRQRRLRPKEVPRAAADFILQLRRNMKFWTPSESLLACVAKNKTR